MDSHDPDLYPLAKHPLGALDAITKAALEVGVSFAFGDVLGDRSANDF